MLCYAYVPWLFLYLFFFCELGHSFPESACVFFSFPLLDFPTVFSLFPLRQPRDAYFLSFSVAYRCSWYITNNVKIQLLIQIIFNNPNYYYKWELEINFLLHCEACTWRNCGKAWKEYSRFAFQILTEVTMKSNIVWVARLPDFTAFHYERQRYS
jgi:hypothetical protein